MVRVGKDKIMVKQVLLVSVVIMILVPLMGCDLANSVLGMVQPGSLLNLSQLQQVDIAGQHNNLIPSYPDYSKDPTCVIPGFCQPNHWYPYSTGQQIASGAMASTK